MRRCLQPRLSASDAAVVYSVAIDAAYFHLSDPNICQDFHLKRQQVHRPCSPPYLFYKHFVCCRAGPRADLTPASSYFSLAGACGTGSCRIRGRASLASSEP